jgi:hypothetical protein
MADVGSSRGPGRGSHDPTWPWMAVAAGAVLALVLDRLRRRLAAA